MTILDGAFGTELQKRGLGPGESPEMWNLSHPDEVRAIHQAYAEAGSDIVVTNTFGANRVKYHGPAALADVIAAAVSLAREGGGKGVRVALDVGPTGRLLRPSGDFEFSAAYDAFAEAIAAGAAAGADLVAIETMADTRELKAAILAARETSSLPVFASVALGTDGKLLTGADVETLAALFEALKPDAAGFNCGLGPDALLPFVTRFAPLVSMPVIVKANAGLPHLAADGSTVFDVTPERFAADLTACVKAGASIVGGCCGTTPRHIAALRAALEGVEPGQPAKCRRTVVSSGSRCVELPFDDTVVIGERINPTGKKRLKEAYLRGDTGYILREAVAQADAGAAILDINAGVPGIDETAVLASTVESVQGVTDLPLQIDTASPAALEAALRIYDGRPLVNSVNGREEVLSSVLPLVARYGGVVVALTLDENGIPPTADGRVAIARRIIERGRAYGLSPDDFIVDVLCLAVSAEPDGANVILESLRRVRAELGVRTVLGVSNISFGLPGRPLLNSSFYTLALGQGLTAAILNPLSVEMMTACRAYRALTGRDRACAAWIAGATAEPPAPVADTLDAAIQHGLRDDAAACARKALADGRTPLGIIDGEIVPALERTGRAFEEKRLYLPQLLMSAEAAGAAFEVLRTALAAEGGRTARRGPIVLATVKGDIHDIGKNIVRALLENYGFDVIDLGRDVPPEAVVEAVRKSSCRLVGLSALMTTTLSAMEETIRALHAFDPAVAVFVGGAVLTEEYAKRIGADRYARDAMASVRIAEAFFGD